MILPCGTPLAGGAVWGDPFIETDYTTAPNTSWSVWYTDFVLVGADGTVHPIFTGWPSSGPGPQMSTWNQAGAWAELQRVLQQLS
jgi:hypothetical protein